MSSDQQRLVHVGPQGTDFSAWVCSVPETTSARGDTGYKWHPLLGT